MTEYRESLEESFRGARMRGVPLYRALGRDAPTASRRRSLDRFLLSRREAISLAILVGIVAWIVGQW